jgi:hypothetical protein
MFKVVQAKRGPPKNNTVKAHAQRKPLAPGWRSSRFIRMAKRTRTAITTAAEMRKEGSGISGLGSFCCRAAEGQPNGRAEIGRLRLCGSQQHIPAHILD